MEQQNNAAPSSIFDFDASNIPAINRETGGIERFNPKPDGAQPYVAQLRLIPNVLDPLQSIVYKQSYWLEENGQGFGYDSPTSLGKEFCPVSTRYWALQNSTNPLLKQMSGTLRLQKRYHCFVQVVVDQHNATQVGKVLPWSVPVPVAKQIEAWLKPSAADIAAGKTAKSLFNLFESHNLILTVTNKTVDGTTMRDYKVEVTDTKTAVTFNGQALQRTPDSQQAFTAYIDAQELPNLVEVYGYKEADVALKTRVKSLLMNAYQDPGAYWPEITVQKVQLEAPGAAAQPAQPAAQAQPAQPAAQAQPAQPAAAPVATAQAQPAQPAAAPVATEQPAASSQPVATPAAQPAVAPVATEQPAASQDAQASPGALDDIAAQILADQQPGAGTDAAGAGTGTA